MNESEKRTITIEKKRGIGVSDIILLSVLLAAGAVLKFFVGSFINIGGMKPNFIIAMYCLAIVLIRPKLYEAAIIGLLAGAVCQLFPGTPYINFASELVGAFVMAVLIMLPMKIGKVSFSTAVSTFVSTVASGSVYTIMLFLLTKAETSAMVAYIPIVFCTAVFNTVIVSALYLPLRKVLKKD